MNSRPAAPGTVRLRDSHCIALLALVTAALFRNVLLGGEVVLSHPIFLDLTHYFYLLRLFGFGLLRKGVIPLWNPYLFCGTPFIADWHTAMFYPPNLIFLFAPVHTGLNWSIAIHFFIAAALTYAFVKSIVGDRFSALISAFAFVFSGPYIVHLLPGHVFNPIPWLPLSLLLAEQAVRHRRIVYYVLGGCVLGLQVLAGHPQYMLYCLGATILYLVFRVLVECRVSGGLRPLGLACIGLALLLAVGLSLSAVQLLPSWEFKDNSSRALLRGPESVSEVSLPPENIVTLIAPFFFGDMHGVRYWGRWLLWETCAYVGILPLVLALIGAFFVRDSRARFFSILALLSLILSFGAYSPLFNVLYSHVPGFNLFRAQAKFISLTAFSLAVLAGYGCRCVLGHPDAARKGLALVGGVVLAAAVVIGLFGISLSTSGWEHSALWRGIMNFRMAGGFQGTPPLHPAEGAVVGAACRVAFNGAAAAAFLLIASGMIILAAISGRPKPAALKVAILALSLGDLWWFGAQYVMASPLSSCYWPRGIADLLSADRSSFRICTPNIAVPGANQNMIEGIRAIDGYETTNVGVYKEYVDFAQGLRSESKLTFEIREITPMLEDLNLKYVILPAEQPFARERYQRRFTDGRVTVYERNDTAPRVYIAHGARIISDGSEILRELRTRGSRIANEVLLAEVPGIPRLDGGDRGKTSRAVITADLPGEVVVSAEISSAAFLVLRDTYYPGWKAYVDGREQPVYRADYAFRAVYLPEGSHSVRFSYEPRSFAHGAMVSLAALSGLALYLAYETVRSSRAARRQ